MKSTIFIIVGAVLWGVIGLFVRYLSPFGFTSMQLVTLRSYVAAVGLLLILLLTDPKKLKIDFRDIWCFVGTGLFSFVFFNTCYFVTMEYASLSVAAILLYTAPFFVMMLSAVFFKEKITFKKVMALLLAFLGCCLVSGLGGSSFSIPPKALLFGLGSGIGYASYSIFGKFALKKYDTLTLVTYTFLVASVGATFLCEPHSMVQTLVAYPVSIGVLILYGLCTGAIAYYCYTKGLEKTPPGRASVLATIEPLVATLCGTLFLKEPLRLSGVIGMLLVLAAVLFLQRQTEV